MTGEPEWNKLLREPNALGWIAFMGVVAIIGVGTLLFIPRGVKTAGQHPVAAVNQPH